MSDFGGCVVLKVATWNINSFRLRENLIVRAISEYSPDLICLQECKSPVEKMPFEAFKELGYSYYAARGQKGYNGVAILSKLPIKAEFSEDFANLGHARHVAAVLESGITVHNFYVPAGGDEPDPKINEKFSQKLDYLTQMEQYFDNVNIKNSILVGDLNIAPRPDDVWDHKKLSTVVSHTPIEIEHLKRVQNAGQWVDVVRQFHPDGKLFSWWSYRAKDWSAADKGRRLDHLWATPDISNLVTSVVIARDVRGWEQPSDHAPIFVVFVV